MQSIVALIFFGTLLVYVQCRSHMNSPEFEITQGLLSGGRRYEIKSVANTPNHFSVRNELFSIGKKLYLLEDGKERYTVKHNLLNIMSTWTITDSVTGKELGTIENKLHFTGSKMTANGVFGHYTIHGRFGNHDFSIEKDGHKVAQIHKKRLHVHDKYGLTVYGDADQALMILFTIIVDEIRQH